MTAAPISSQRWTIRPAEPRDLDAVVALIHELAEFEQLSHLCGATSDKLRPHLFGERPVVDALVVDADGAIVAFALYFTNFSTFLAQPGLYLEDLYVQPAWRGGGIASALMQRLAATARERRCGRFEWSVLDWNAKAIGFYERLGATVLPDWRICRVTGDALRLLAG